MSQEYFDGFFAGKRTLNRKEQAILKQLLVSQATAANDNSAYADREGNRGSAPAAETPVELQLRRILVPRKRDSQQYNTDKLPMESDMDFRVFCAQDAIVGMFSKAVMNQTTLHDAVQVPPNMPSYRLVLKIGQPAMLVGNINPAIGLFRGAQVLIRHMSAKGIQVTLLTGEHRGTHISVPRIPFIDLYGDDGAEPTDFRFQRLQFPFRPIFAETIGHSQGQTFDFVGIDHSGVRLTRSAICVALSRNLNLHHVVFLGRVDGIVGAVRVKL